MNLLPACLGGFAALGLGYLGNTAIWRFLGPRGTVWAVPLWEEFVKSSAGVFAGHLLLVHGLFGLGEACLEARRGAVGAASLALASHLCFGLLARSLWKATGSFGAAWLGPAAAHLAWNWLVYRLSAR